MITEARRVRTPVISHAIGHSSIISASHVHVPWATLVHSIIGVSSAHIARRPTSSHIKRMRHISRAPSHHVMRMGHVAWTWSSPQITRRMRHIARAWWSSPRITRMRHISWSSSHHVTTTKWRMRHISRRRTRSSHVTTRRRHIPVKITGMRSVTIISGVMITPIGWGMIHHRMHVSRWMLTWWWEIISIRNLISLRGRLSIVFTLLIFFSLWFFYFRLLLLFHLLFLLLICTCPLLQMFSIREVKCLFLLFDSQPLPLGLVFRHFCHCLGFSATFLRLEFMIA